MSTLPQAPMNQVPMVMVTDLLLNASGNPSNSVCTATLNNAIYYGSGSLLLAIPAGSVFKAAVVNGVLAISLPLWQEGASSLDFALQKNAWQIVYSGDISGKETWCTPSGVFNPGDRLARSQVLITPAAV